MDSASTAALLALVALSDGLRLLPAGAIVVSRLAFGDWGVTWVNADRQSGSRLRLISWCSPIQLPVILTAAADDLPVKRRLARFHARRRRARGHVAALRVGGVLSLAALIAGIPWLTARLGAWGLLLGITVVVWLCLIQTVIAIAAYRRVGVTLGRALRTSAKYLWPFSAPRAAEDVMHRVVGGVPPLILMHELLSADAFRRFARPLLFDAVVRGERSVGIAELRAYVGESWVAELMNQAPSDRDGDAYCPRCGASFYRGTRFCSDCAEVELRALTTA